MNYLKTHFKLKYALQIIIILFGGILSILGIFVIKDEHWNDFLKSIGAALVSVPLYDIIIKYIKGIEKDDVQKENEKLKNDLNDLMTTFKEVEKRSLSGITSLMSTYQDHIKLLYGQKNMDYAIGKTSYVLFDESNIMNFINIGVSSNVISDKYKFKTLIDDTKYIGTTVLIIGTWFRPLSSIGYGGDSKTLEKLDDALKRGVNFKFVLSDPDSIFLRDEDKKKKIRCTIDNIRSLKSLYQNHDPSPKGTIELKLCPYDDRLHSFSLFESEDDLIATLDYNFGYDNNVENKCSQMFFYKKENQREINDKMLNSIIDHYNNKFNESIPFLKYTPNGEKFKVFICLKKGEKILVKSDVKKARSLQFLKVIPNCTLSDLEDVCGQIKILLTDNNLPDIQFLKAFQEPSDINRNGSEGETENVTDIYIVGEMYDQGKVKDCYDFVKFEDVVQDSHGSIVNKVYQCLETIK